MHFHRIISLVLLLFIGSALSVAYAQEMSLQPKYGLQPKNETQKAADTKFLAAVDDQYKGNRKKKIL